MSKAEILSELPKLSPQDRGEILEQLWRQLANPSRDAQLSSIVKIGQILIWTEFQQDLIQPMFGEKMRHQYKRTRVFQFRNAVNALLSDFARVLRILNRRWRSHG